jgi:flagellar biosynthesis/type III secretory pathway protein FliH
MAMISRANAEHAAKDAIVLDLGDLARQGESLRARARQEAETILAQARAERERLISTARAEGLTRGLAEGREQGRREGAEAGRAAALQEHKAALAAVEQGWAKALAEFLASRERTLAQARADMLTLAVRLAGRIVKRAVHADPGVAAAQVEAVLASVARRTRLVIRVNPLDEPAVRAALPALLARMPTAEHAELLPDPAVSRGSCLASTAGGGLIDATIEAQLDAVARQVLGEGADPPVGAP